MVTLKDFIHRVRSQNTALRLTKRKYYSTNNCKFHPQCDEISRGSIEMRRAFKTWLDHEELVGFLFIQRRSHCGRWGGVGRGGEGWLALTFDGLMLYVLKVDGC